MICVLAAVMTGCISSEKVILGGKKVTIITGADFKANQEFDKKVWARIKDFNYAARYAAIFEADQQIEQAKDVKAGGQNLDKTVAEASVAYSAVGAAMGFGLSAGDIAGLGVTLLIGTKEDRTVQTVISYDYQGLLNESVFAVKLEKGLSPQKTIVQNYVLIKEIFANDCQKYRPFSYISVANAGAHSYFDGSCKNPDYWTSVESRDIAWFPYFKAPAEGGSLIYFQMGGKDRTAEERKALGNKMRQKLSQDWYVIQTMEVGKETDGSPKRLVTVFHNGQVKAYPMPPVPVFK